MTIFLTANTRRKKELRDVRRQLSDMGHLVTSSWVDATDPAGDTAPSLEESRRDAERRMLELAGADIVLAFTDPPVAEVWPAPLTRGTQHVDVGVALGMGKRVWIVGYHENLFHSLARVRYFPSWAMLKLELMT